MYKKKKKEKRKKLSRPNDMGSAACRRLREGPQYRRSAWYARGGGGRKGVKRKAELKDEGEAR